MHYSCWTTYQNGDEALSKSLRLLQSVKRAARAMEVMLYTVERELPETAAAIRLSSMELSDAIEEVTLLR